jgi:hypothetical protein
MEKCSHQISHLLRHKHNLLVHEDTYNPYEEDYTQGRHTSLIETLSSYDYMVEDGSSMHTQAF